MVVGNRNKYVELEIVLLVQDEQKADDYFNFVWALPFVLIVRQSILLESRASKWAPNLLGQEVSGLNWNRVWTVLA